jgi:hypothetical protein
MVTPVRTAGGHCARPASMQSSASWLKTMRCLRGVQRRASSVLALAAARTWPYAELDALTAFLRAAVRPHATNEEDRLYPDRVAAPFTQLHAEHAHICALTEQLEHSTPPPAPCQNYDEWSTVLSIT